MLDSENDMFFVGQTGSGHDWRYERELFLENESHQQRHLARPSSSWAVMLIVVSYLQVLLAAGVVFGSSILLLDWEKLVSFMCVGEDSCQDSILYLQLVYTAGVVAHFVAYLPFGFLLDRFGPKLTSLLGSCCLLVGTILCCFSGMSPQVFLPLGFALIAAAGPGILLPTIQFTNLFPQKRGLLLALNTAMYCASAGVFVLLHALDGDDFQSMMKYYLAAPVFCFVTALLLWPPVNFELPRDVGEMATADASPVRMPYYNATLKHQCGSRMFIYLLCYMSVHVLRLNFVCGIILYQLDFLFTESQAASLSQVFISVLPWGIVALPLCWGVGGKRQAVGTTHTLLNLGSICSAVWSVCFFFPVNAVQYVGFAFIAVSRQLIFNNSAHVAVEFGFDNLGLLLGLLNGLVGLVSVLQYFLVWLAEQQLGNDYGIVTVGLLITLFPLLFVSPIDPELDHKLRLRVAEANGDTLERAADPFDSSKSVQFHKDDLYACQSGLGGLDADMYEPEPNRGGKHDVIDSIIKQLKRERAKLRQQDLRVEHPELYEADPKYA